MIVDCHIHILPSVDDGPSSLRESENMLAASARAGTTRIIATYHYRVGMFESTLEDAVRALADLRKSELGAKLVLGEPICEAHLDPALLDALRHGDIGLIGRRVFLLELSHMHHQVLLNAVFALRTMALVPIICHPERYVEGIDHIQSLRDARSAGCLIQVDAGALMGSQGRELRRRGDKLLQAGLVDMLGSDAHAADDGCISALAAASVRYPVLADGSALARVLEGASEWI
ncbi:MAG: CpsB/CapC family capsule biosynthesis tyrosine phosphatase [Candidatus Brocadiia bacterium]